MVAVYNGCVNTLLRVKSRKGEKMKLSQKIVEQRKKHGWSQEDLAFQLNVSRQSVSKWESDLALPEIDKIVQMATLFGVSCDYLLKNEEDPISTVAEPVAQNQSNVVEETPIDKPVKHLSEQEIAEVVSVVHKKGIVDAIATALCVLSPVTLIFLASLAAFGGVSAQLAVGVGLGVLFVLVAVAVVMFVVSGNFVICEEVVSEQSKVAFKQVLQCRSRLFVVLTAVASGLCVLSAVPLVVVACFGLENIVAPMVCVLLIVVALAVALFVYVGTFGECIKAIVGKTQSDKADSKPLGAKINSLFWSVVLSGYLLWSFLSSGWSYTWIVWPVAAILSTAINVILNLFGIKTDEE